LAVYSFLVFRGGGGGRGSDGRNRVVVSR
jgi:hypothetical protein